MAPYYRETAGAAALGFSRELTGLPYIWGGPSDGSEGTDCDGLWTFGYSKVGVTLIRPTEITYTQAVFDQRNGHRADPNEPGDLLFYEGAPPGHVAGYVSPGRIFQAERTGTLIGEFDGDTTGWLFRTRPALLLPPFVPPPPVPGSPFERLGASHRPKGPLPLFIPGERADPAWLAFARELGTIVGLYHDPVHLGGYGPKTQHLCVESKDHWRIPRDGTFGDRVWGARVWHAYGVR